MEKEEYIAIEGMQLIVKGRKRSSIGNCIVKSVLVHHGKCMG